LVAVIPLVAWLRSNPRHLTKAFIAIGALPYVMGAFPKYKISIYGVPEWPGFAQGFDISIMDLMVVAVYLCLPPAKNPLPFKLTFAFYIGVVLFSAALAPVPIASFYYVWQLCRMFMVYAVVARICDDPDRAVCILKGLALGLCFQGVFVFWQRFVLHFLHVTGTYPHQNTLGFVTHFVIYPFFGLLLAGRREWQVAAIPFIGLVIDVITASRAALGLAFGGLSLMFLLSTFRQWTVRKAALLGVGVLVVALLTPLIFRQFELRFNAMGDPTYGRAELNDAASMIVSDHPFGIGVNNFVVFANVHRYYDRAFVGDLNRVFPHNIYFTTAAEIGYLGLLALIVFLWRPMLAAFSCSWRNRMDQRGDLLLGLGVSLLIVSIHAFFEWTFFHDLVQYLLALNIGIIAGVTQQLGYWSPAGRLLKPQPKMNEQFDPVMMSKRQRP
jgi:O-antigen ligase